MAIYDKKLAGDGSMEVWVRTQPREVPTVRAFMTEADANRWIRAQIELEHPGG
jgi:hypothetical protein